MKCFTWQFQYVSKDIKVTDSKFGKSQIIKTGMGAIKAMALEGKWSASRVEERNKERESYPRTGCYSPLLSALLQCSELAGGKR